MGTPLDMTVGVASNHADRFQNAPRPETLSTAARDAVDFEFGTHFVALTHALGRGELDEVELREHASIGAGLRNVAVNLIDGPLSEIARNRDLTPGGKLRQRQEAAKLALKASDNYATEAAKLRESVKVADESFVKAGKIEKPGDLSDPEWETQQAAVRAHLATVADPLGREALYRQALDENNLVVLAALESMGPVVGPSGRFEVAVSLTLVKEKRHARGRARYPEVAAQRDKNERLVTTYATAAQLIAAQLREVVDNRQIEVL